MRLLWCRWNRFQNFLKFLAMGIQPHFNRKQDIEPRYADYLNFILVMFHFFASFYSPFGSRFFNG